MVLLFLFGPRLENVMFCRLRLTELLEFLLLILSLLKVDRLKARFVQTEKAVKIFFRRIQSRCATFEGRD